MSASSTQKVLWAITGCVTLRANEGIIPKVLNDKVI